MCETCNFSCLIAEKAKIFSVVLYKHGSTRCSRSSLVSLSQSAKAQLLRKMDIAAALTECLRETHDGDARLRCHRSIVQCVVGLQQYMEIMSTLVHWRRLTRQTKQLVDGWT